jgi:hypothetical protein
MDRNRSGVLTLTQVRFQSRARRSFSNWMTLEPSAELRLRSMATPRHLLATP